MRLLNFISCLIVFQLEARYLLGPTAAPGRILNVIFDMGILHQCVHDEMDLLLVDLGRLSGFQVFHITQQFDFLVD